MWQVLKHHIEMFTERQLRFCRRFVNIAARARIVKSNRRAIRLNGALCIINQGRQSPQAYQFCSFYINLYSPKRLLHTKTRQRKHKYKQSENSDQVHRSSWHLEVEYKQNIVYNHLSSPNLIIYNNLLQNLQKPFTVEMYRNINLPCFF